MGTARGKITDGYLSAMTNSFVASLRDTYYKTYYRELIIKPSRVSLSYDLSCSAGTKINVWLIYVTVKFYRAKIHLTMTQCNLQRKITIKVPLRETSLKAASRG